MSGAPFTKEMVYAFLTFMYIAIFAAAWVAGHVAGYFLHFEWSFLKALAAPTLLYSAAYVSWKGPQVFTAAKQKLFKKG